MQYDWIEKSQATQEAWDTSLEWRCRAAEVSKNAPGAEQWRELLTQDAQESYNEKHTPRHTVSSLEAIQALVTQYGGRISFEYPDQYGRRPTTFVVELLCNGGIFQCYAQDAEMAETLREAWQEYRYKARG